MKVIPKGTKAKGLTYCRWPQHILARCICLPNPHRVLSPRLPPSFSSSALASFKSAVSKLSVNPGKEN